MSSSGSEQPRPLNILLRPEDVTGPALFATICLPHRMNENLFLDFVLADPLKAFSPEVVASDQPTIDGKHVARIVLPVGVAKILAEQLLKVAQ